MRPILPTYQQVTQLPQTYETKVSDEWIDVMGHMNVAYYTSSFSSAMQSLRSSFGMDDQYIQLNHIGSFAIETHTRYIAESRIGEQLHVHSRILDRSGSQKRLHAMHIMVNPERQTLSASFEAIVAIVDLKTRRMTPIKPAILDQIDQLIAEHRKLDWAPPVCGVLSVS